eukprot:s278_g42.t2
MPPCHAQEPASDIWAFADLGPLISFVEKAIEYGRLQRDPLIPVSAARSSSSVDSFQADDELQKLEKRLGMKIGTMTPKPVATVTPKPVATPARATMTAMPKVNACPPKVAMPSGPSGPAAAKAGSGPARVDSVSAKSTPIKSPELKRPKKDLTSPSPNATVVVSKNLKSEFDLAADSQQSSGASQPVSWLCTPMPPASTPPASGDAQRLSRDITTMTTLPLGSSVEDLDACESNHLDVPLMGLIKSFPAGTPMEEILIDIDLWVKRRNHMGDIKHVDPSHATSVLEIGVIHTQLVDRARTLSGMKVEKDCMEQKLQLAARAMKSRQHKRATEMFPDKDPLETDFFKVHVETINKWVVDKLQPLVDAMKVFEKFTSEIGEQLLRMLENLTDNAMKEQSSDPLDLELMRELTSFVSADPASEKNDVEMNARLRDHAEVASFKGVEEIEQGASEPPTPHLRAQARGTPGNASSSGPGDDGPPIRIKPNGHVETEAERGRYRMTMYKDLKALYGAGVAKTLRDQKKDLENSKGATDSITYWCEHPDFKGMSGKEDWDLQQATGNELGRLQSTAPGFHAESGGDGRAPPGEEPAQKPKKVPNTQRLVASKMAMLSSKNAEILSWPNVLKEGFAKELEARKVALDACKAELEILYSQGLDDLAGKPDLSNKALYATILPKEIEIQPAPLSGTPSESLERAESWTWYRTSEEMPRGPRTLTHLQPCRAHPLSSTLRPRRLHWMSHPRHVDEAIPVGRDDEIRSYFQEHGFVVVEGVFSDEDIDMSLEELWTSQSLLGRSPEIRRDDPLTWTKDSSCWHLAQNPNVAHVMAMLWRDAVQVMEPEDSKVVFLGRTPRWGVMRPSGGNPAWRTLENWLHWDQNPWAQPGFGWIQAFACITAQTPSSGGLLCVPGFHKRWKSWGEAHPEGSVQVDGKSITRDFGQGNPFPVPLDDPLHGEVVRVCAPRGSLVLWDSRLPHQNYPNSSEDEWRVVLYMNFWPYNEQNYKERRALLLKRFHVLQALGADRADATWPRRLTPHGRAVTAAPETTEGTVEESCKEAIRLTFAAGEAELRGELEESTRLMRRAMKLWPEVETWYDAIFI